MTLRQRGGASGFLSIPRCCKDTSVEELAVDLKRKPFEIRLLVNALLREEAIVKLVSDREGGPFFAPAGYVEASEKRDHSSGFIEITAAGFTTRRRGRTMCEGALKGFFNFAAFIAEF